MGNAQEAVSGDLVAQLFLATLNITIGTELLIVQYEEDMTLIQEAVGLRLRDGN